MDTIFIISKNSGTSESHRLLLNLTDTINLKVRSDKWYIVKRSDKYVPLSNLSIYYTSKNIKKSCNNNKFNPNLGGG